MPIAPVTAPSPNRPLAKVLRAHLLAGAAALLPGLARGAEAWVPELEQRLERAGVEAVNAHLTQAQGAAAMTALNRLAGACDLSAVSLAVRLSRSRNASASRAHVQSLRAATGRCPGFVLALATQPEIPRFCGSLASWSAVQTARELRRRTAEIDADATLRSSRRGQACRAAYQYELQHTRVMVRRVAAAGAPAGEP